MVPEDQRDELWSLPPLQKGLSYRTVREGAQLAFRGLPPLGLPAGLTECAEYVHFNGRPNEINVLKV